jgi:putative oxidoreductase
MSLNHYFQNKTLPSLGLLTYRVAMGSAFVFHGLMKAPTATTWMGDTVPGFLQAFAAYSELLGGAALALGFLTPMASLALLGTMTGALYFHLSQGDPFVGMPDKGSYELALAYWTGALLFLLNSPGKFSVDYWMLKTFKSTAQSPTQSGIQA